MGQSLVKNYLHLIFSTKHREGLIFPPIETELYSYMAGICSNLDCPALKVGGHIDHVHLLCRLSKNIALVQLMRELKANSSTWMKKQAPQLSQFYWQTGYGAFSVSPSEADSVKFYIQNQHAHHQKQTYQDEFRYHLRINDMEWDENHIWD